jgi:hypothetical protein
VPSTSKKAKVRALIAARGWARVGEEEWKVLAATVPQLSTADLRDAGVPVEAPWSGVRQKTLEELEIALDALGAVYAARADLRRFCRDEVIRAKDRARLASRNRRVSEEKRALKAEMVDWMLVWLGDPAMFPAWAALRRNREGMHGRASG